MRSGVTRFRLVVVVSLAVLAVCLAVASLVLGQADGVDEVGLTAWVIAASALGAFIEVRTSGNPMARLLLATGVLGSVAAFSDVMRPADVGGLTTSEAFWWGLGGITFFSFMWSTLCLMPSVFPTGKPLSRPWSWVVRAGATALVVATPVSLFSSYHCAQPGEGVCDVAVANPIGISWVPHPEYGWFGTVFFALFALTILLGLVSLVVRFVRARGIERQQIKWLLVVIAFNVLWVIAEGVIWVDLLGNEETSSVIVAVMEAVSWASIPVAIALAVLRYRLYEIDRIVSRTVTYTLVVGLLIGVVLGVSALAGTQFQDPMVVAATTLGVAAAFNPLRRRVQRVVDRRFNRSRYDHERVVEEFAARLRDQVDPGHLIADWTQVASDTMEPTSMGVWVRGR